MAKIGRKKRPGPKRRPGRPRKETSKKYRQRQRARLRAERYFFAKHIYKKLLRRGYNAMAKAPLTVERAKEIKTELKAAGLEATPVEAKKYDAEAIVKNVVETLLLGKEVPGFALVPTERAATNPTVKKIYFEFTDGPAAGLALCEVKHQ